MEEVCHKVGCSKSYVLLFSGLVCVVIDFGNGLESVRQVYLVIPYCVRYELCEAKKSAHDGHLQYLSLICN